MEHWYAHQGGKKALRNLVKDLDAVSKRGSDDSLRRSAQRATILRNDSQVDLSIAPIPSKSIERLWVAGLNDYEQAGTVCVNGVNDNSGSEIQQATDDIAVERASIDQLTFRNL